MVAPVSDPTGILVLAADHHPVHRETGDDVIEETDFFDELDSSNLTTSEEVEVKDYNSYHADAPSPPPSSSSPAERLFVARRPGRVYDLGLRAATIYDRENRQALRVRLTIARGDPGLGSGEPD